MGFRDIFVRCSGGHYSSSCCCSSSYQRLHYQTDDMTVMQGKLRQQPSGDAISCNEKLSTWRHFYSALVLRRVLDDDAGFGPFIVFSSPWGLPVLSHPVLSHRKKKIGSSYRKVAL